MSRHAVQVLPPPPELPPGIGITAANAATRAPRALSLEEEVRAAEQAAHGRGPRTASVAAAPASARRRGGSPEPAPTAAQREYASERSRAALAREEADREYASERSRAADLRFTATVNAAANAVATHPPHLRASAELRAGPSGDPPRAAAVRSGASVERAGRT